MAFSLNHLILSRTEAPSTFGCGYAALCYRPSSLRPSLFSSPKLKTENLKLTTQFLAS
jgi:hypothetical protein